MVIIKAVHWIKKIDKQFIGGQIIDNFSVTDDWQQKRRKIESVKNINCKFVAGNNSQLSIKNGKQCFETMPM